VIAVEAEFEQRAAIRTFRRKICLQDDTLGRFPSLPSSRSTYHKRPRAEQANKMNESRKLGPKNSPLVEYALKGLELCWLPEFGRWSHIYHLDKRDPPNESVPESDVFYTLNVLLGLAHVRHLPGNYDLTATFQRSAAQLVTLPVPKYALGTALWTSAELLLELPSHVLTHIEDRLSDKNHWRHFHAQDLGMILVGVTAQAKLDPKKWSRRAAELFAFLVDQYRSRSALFYDVAFGPRRRFASFATQTYLTLACYAYGELANDIRAIDIANACTRKLIALQGPNGEWPWFFDAVTGSVLDFYEVYSVHQCGMAPAFLERAEQHGVSEARGAIVKGFNWILGKNQLAMPMLVPELHLTIRSQARQGELNTKRWRILRAVSNSTLGRRSQLIDPPRLQLRLECRSYELGWILWSFGHRTDLPELTHHEMFSESLKKAIAS
jgi:hypothetical protein